LFTSITWWRLMPDTNLVVSVQPHPNRPAAGASSALGQVRAARNAEGDLAVIYVPGGGVVTLKGDLLRDQLKPLWFSPLDGGMRNARALRDRVYRTPTADDWVLLFRNPCNCSFRDFDNEFEK
jgi:Putative collagen-binding domain of a collagenase